MKGKSSITWGNVQVARQSKIKGKFLKSKRFNYESFRDLPVGMDRSSRTERKELFWKLDDNGNGMLSLLETREGLEKILGNTNMTKWAYGWKSAF